ncbi:MAG: hypothetical protein JNM69_19590, partial [Archangium sp.]|nr:hypothetical protein [Archangium sp.]
NRDTPRFKLYFKKAPSEGVRLALGAQIGASQSWPSALAAESEPSLKALATDFTNALAAGKAALDARAAAQIATATHRARELVPFVDDLNAARQSVYGQLTTIAGQTRKPRGWAESFFLRSSSGDEATPTSA